MGLFTFLLLSFKSSLYIFREGNVNLLQYSCLENPMDREALWAMVHGVAVRHDWVINALYILDISILSDV